MPKFDIFNIKTEKEFEKISLEVFKYQAQYNKIYRKYLSLLNIEPNAIKKIENIPFLPISFFKFHKVITGEESKPIEAVFKSSGTTSNNRSHHFITDLKIYIQSFTKGFNHFFGDFKEYCFLALLPSYIEQGDSSLVFMITHFIKNSKCKESGFYLSDFKKLKQKIIDLNKKKKKIILFGVSYSLIDFAKFCNFEQTNSLMVFETGGMKGKRKEIPKEDLHNILKKGFGVKTIYSEYGMTELLSQAYSKGNGLFKTVPWMKIFIRDRYDPFHLLGNGKTGGINIIDLANINSCAFIETEDLGKKYADGSFEILGRFDSADIRGCNLMISE